MRNSHRHWDLGETTCQILERVVIVCESSARYARATTPSSLVLIPMTTQSKSLRLADTLARNPFAFPGGYPMFAVTSDGACLCHKCCSTERESIGTTTG